MCIFSKKMRSIMKATHQLNSLPKKSKSEHIIQFSSPNLKYMLTQSIKLRKIVDSLDVNDRAFGRAWTQWNESITSIGYEVYNNRDRILKDG